MVPTVLDRGEEFIAGNLANTNFPLKVKNIPTLPLV
jgi:hypothetical protein